MDLHRTDKLPEWEMIPEDKWNEHQRRAAETNGWDTPGNRETLKGLAATLAGIYAIHKEHYGVGLALTAYGRWKDIKDGKVANATGTKSPDGERNDATADTITLAAAALVIYQDKLIPRWQTSTIVGQKLINIGATAVAKSRGREIHPTKAGKLNTAFVWLRMGGAIIRKMSEKRETIPFTSITLPAPETIEVMENATFAVSTILGAVANREYIQAANDDGTPKTMAEFTSRQRENISLE